MRHRAASKLLGLIPQAEQQGSVKLTGNGLLGTGLARIGGAKGSGASGQTRAAAALPAQQVATKLQPEAMPLTRIDEVGAISIIEPHEKDFVPKVFENVDGRRIEDGRYAAFINEVSGGWT